MARDVTFFERPIVSVLGQFRIVPDTVIIVLGVLPLVYFLFRTYPHLKQQKSKGDDIVTGAEN